jgi:hypothetical protein
MAFAAPDVCVKTRPGGLDAVWFYGNTLLCEWKGANQSWLKDEMLARVRGENIGHRADVAQIPFPNQWGRGRIEQAAFLVVATTIIVAIKVTAFSSSRCPHQTLGLDAGDVSACASVDPDHIANIDELRYLDLKSGLGGNLLRHPGSRIPAHGDL